MIGVILGRIAIMFLESILFHTKIILYASWVAGHTLHGVLGRRVRRNKAGLTPEMAAGMCKISAVDLGCCENVRVERDSDCGVERVWVCE